MASTCGWPPKAASHCPTSWTVSLDLKSFPVRSHEYWWTKGPALLTSSWGLRLKLLNSVLRAAPEDPGKQHSDLCVIHPLDSLVDSAQVTPGVCFSWPWGCLPNWYYQRELILLENHCSHYILQTNLAQQQAAWRKQTLNDSNPWLWDKNPSNAHEKYALIMAFGGRKQHNSEQCTLLEGLKLYGQMSKEVGKL